MYTAAQRNIMLVRFVGKALSVVIENWPCVKSALLCEGGDDTVVGGQGEWPFILSTLERQHVLEMQSHTRHLDVLTCTLLTKLSHQVSATPYHDSLLIKVAFVYSQLQLWGSG